MAVCKMQISYNIASQISLLVLIYAFPVINDKKNDIH